MNNETLETTLKDNNILETEISDSKVLETEVAGIQKSAETDHSKLNNLDYEHSGHIGFQPAGNYIEDSNYVHTDNNYTTEEKTKLSNLENYDDTEIKRDIQSLEDTKVDREVNKGLSTNDYTNEEKSKLASLENYDDTEVKADISALEDIETTQNQEIVNIKANKADKSEIPDISGKQDLITSTNKLSSDLVDDINKTNKFVTSAEKTTWNNKSDFSGDYNDLSNKPTIPTKTSDLTNDNDFIDGLTLLTYGVSTWSDFIEAYNKNKVVYCYVDGRLAFMAYRFSNKVEFQYYRSLGSPTMSNQPDEVYVYTLQSSGWATTIRKASTTILEGTGITRSYTGNSRTMTIGVDTDIIATKDYVGTEIANAIGTALGGSY